MANSLFEVARLLATPDFAGSSPCPKPLKYVTTPGVVVTVTVPVLFGSAPTTTGPSLKALNEERPVVVEAPVVNVNGAPDTQLKIPASCQSSTTRLITDVALLRNLRFESNGNANVPLLMIWWVRSNPSGPRLRLRSRRVLKTSPPSSSAIPMDLLQVYEV